MQGFLILSGAIAAVLGGLLLLGRDVTDGLLLVLIAFVCFAGGGVVARWMRSESSSRLHRHRNPFS